MYGIHEENCCLAVSIFYTLEAITWGQQKITVHARFCHHTAKYIYTAFLLEDAVWDSARLNLHLSYIYVFTMYEGGTGRLNNGFITAKYTVRVWYYTCA